MLPLQIIPCFKFFLRAATVAFSYPEFHVRGDEDVEEFLEKMKVAYISNQIYDPVQMLRLL